MAESRQTKVFRGKRFPRKPAVDRDAGPSRDQPEIRVERPPLAEPMKAKPQRSQPKMLSTTTSKLQNDPLWIEFDGEDFGGLTPYRGRDQFAVTVEGFIPLVERCYQVIVSANRGFGKFISQAMFNWYCTQFLYVRLSILRQSSGISTHEEEAFISEIQNKSYSVPAALDTYLKSIGDVIDADGGRYYLAFPAFPNVDGHFGRVDQNTHVHYESMIAPLVASTRIREDLRYTTQANHAQVWNLEAALRPAGEAAGSPTKNMLGWGLSVFLTTEQRQVLESSGITNDAFGLDRAQFQTNRALMNLISDHVFDAERIMKMVAPMGTSPTGSFGLIPYVDRDVNEGVPFSRVLQYSEAGNSRVVSSSQMDKRFVQGAMIASFRVKKEPVAGVHSYACYDFAQYANVPANWQATRNVVFNYGAVADWNRIKFTSAFGSKDALRTSWVRKTLCK